LSKKNLQEEDIAECTARFNKSKAVHSIMSHVVQQQTEEPFVEIEELYKMVGWPLYKKFEHAYDSFKKAARYQLIALTETDLTNSTVARISSKELKCGRP